MKIKISARNWKDLKKKIIWLNVKITILEDEKGKKKLKT